MTTIHEAATGDFHQFLDRDWAYWTAQFPEWATVIGERGHNDRWTDASPEAIAGRAAHLRESARQLARIDRATLSSDADRLNLDLYRDLVDTAVQGLAFHLDPFPIRSVVPRMPLSAVNQLEGVPQDVPMVLSLMPAESVADYEDMLDVMFQAYDQITKALRPGCTAKDLREAGQVIVDRGSMTVAPRASVIAWRSVRGSRRWSRPPRSPPASRARDHR